MLLNKIGETKELIENVQQMQAQVNKYKLFEKFRTESEEYYVEAQNLIEVYSLLRRYYPTHFQVMDLTPVIEIIQGWLEQLEKKTVPARTRIKGVVELIQSANWKLKGQWQEYVRIVTNDKVELLTLLQGLVDEPQAILNLVNSVKHLKEKWPVIARDIDQLQNLLAETDQLIQSLNADRSIQQFLKLVMNKEAKLSDITPEVWEWLNKHNFAKNLDITFSSSRRRRDA